MVDTKSHRLLEYLVDIRATTVDNPPTVPDAIKRNARNDPKVPTNGSPMAGRTSVSPPSPGVHSRRPYFSSQLSARAAREDEDELPEDRTVTDFPASAKPLLCDAPGSPSCRSDYDSACNLRPPTPPPGTFPCPAKGYFSAAAGRLAALFAAFFGLVAVLAAVRHAVPMPKTHDYRDLRFDWTPFDPRYLEPLDKDFGPYNLLVDTHSHTTFSDGR